MISSYIFSVHLDIYIYIHTHLQSDPGRNNYQLRTNRKFSRVFFIRLSNLSRMKIISRSLNRATLRFKRIHFIQIYIISPHGSSATTTTAFIMSFNSLFTTTELAFPNIVLSAFTTDDKSSMDSTIIVS